MPQRVRLVTLLFNQGDGFERALRVATLCLRSRHARQRVVTVHRRNFGRGRFDRALYVADLRMEVSKR